MLEPSHHLLHHLRLPFIPSDLALMSFPQLVREHDSTPVNTVRWLAILAEITRRLNGEDGNMVAASWLRASGG